MSRHGERLALPAAWQGGGAGHARCPATGELYRLEGETLTLCSSPT
jgi:UDP-2-acetamido-3-amino-2,3-dideoxy-glucuronate N-acetyltransferase